jgi:hypothetical protein
MARRFRSAIFASHRRFPFVSSALS